jgi:predicted SAM-dependent methyltransferase
MEAKQLRLNIGGTERRDGWTILNIEPGPIVDVVGPCDDLSQFANDSVAEIYASHVYEHLSHNCECRRALTEAHRVLVPGGQLRISVPDFELLCRMYLHTSLGVLDRWKVMEMIFGGQLDAHDFHRIGMSWEFISIILGEIGFTDIQRVKEFGIFQDCSSIRFHGALISLNVLARKHG